MKTRWGFIVVVLSLVLMTSDGGALAKQLKNPPDLNGTWRGRVSSRTRLFNGDKLMYETDKMDVNISVDGSGNMAVNGTVHLKGGDQTFDTTGKSGSARFWITGEITQDSTTVDVTMSGRAVGKNNIRAVGVAIANDRTEEFKMWLHRRK